MYFGKIKDRTEKKKIGLCNVRGWPENSAGRDGSVPENH